MGSLSDPLATLTVGDTVKPPSLPHALRGGGHCLASVRVPRGGLLTLPEEGKERRGARRGRGGQAKAEGHWAGPPSDPAMAELPHRGHLVGGRGQGWPQSPGVPATGRDGHGARGLGRGWRRASLHPLVAFSASLVHPLSQHVPMTASPPGAGPRRFGRSRTRPPGAPGRWRRGKRGTTRTPRPTRAPGRRARPRTRNGRRGMWVPGPRAVCRPQQPRALGRETRPGTSKGHSPRDRVDEENEAGRHVT